MISNKICLIIICSLVFFSNTLALAEMGSDLSVSSPLKVRRFLLATCFKKADDFNKEILVATTNLSIAKALIIIAKAIPNPVYNLLYGWGPAWEYIVAGNNQQFGWTEEIQILGRRSKKTNVANANYFQIAFQIEAIRFNIHNQVRRAYIDLAAAHAYENAIKIQVGNSQKLLSITQKRFAVGKASGLEVEQAKLTSMQIAVLQNQAIGKLIKASMQLCKLMGETPYNDEIIDVDEKAIFCLTGEFNALDPAVNREIPPLTKLLPTAWINRNDLKTLIQQAYTDKKSLVLAKTQRLPDPFVGFNYMFSTYKPYQPQYFLPGVKVPQQPGYLFTYGQELPLFYQYRGQIDQAKNTWLQDFKQNDLLKSQIALDIVLAYEALLSLKANLDKYQNELLPSSFKVCQLSRRGYELGKTDLITAILSQQQYMQLIFSYFDTIVAYHNAWADLEKAIGLPLINS